jgi:hypothetical protein
VIALGIMRPALASPFPETGSDETPLSVRARPPSLRAVDTGPDSLVIESSGHSPNGACPEATGTAPAARRSSGLFPGVCWRGLDPRWPNSRFSDSRARTSLVRVVFEEITCVRDFAGKSLDGPSTRRPRELDARPPPMSFRMGGSGHFPSLRLRAPSGRRFLVLSDLAGGRAPLSHSVPRGSLAAGLVR